MDVVGSWSGFKSGSRRHSSIKEKELIESFYGQSSYLGVALISKILLFKFEGLLHLG